MGYYFRKYHYWALLFSQIVLIALSAFMEDSFLLAIFFVAALLRIYGSIIFAFWHARLPRIFAILAGAVAIISGMFLIAPHGSIPEALLAAVASFSFAMLLFIAIWAIAKQIFTSERVDIQIIVGAASLYLLFGLFFAFFNSGIDSILPAAFNFSGEGIVRVQDFRDHIYFSFAALTTTGFGDVVAMIPVAKLSATFECILGAIYLAFMVARLVGMHISQRLQKA